MLAGGGHLSYAAPRRYVALALSVTAIGYDRAVLLEADDVLTAHRYAHYIGPFRRIRPG